MNGRKFYTEMLTKYSCCVIVDETYVKADFQPMQGQEFYTGKDKFKVDDRFEKKKMSKFASKYPIWQAIYTCGKQNETFVTTGNINGEIH